MLPIAVNKNELGMTTDTSNLYDTDETGNLTVNVAPAGGLLEAVSVPPCSVITR